MRRFADLDVDDLELAGFDDRPRAEIPGKPHHFLERRARQDHRIAAPAFMRGPHDRPPVAGPEGLDQLADMRRGQTGHVGKQHEHAGGLRRDPRDTGRERTGHPRCEAGIVDDIEVEARQSAPTIASRR